VTDKASENDAAMRNAAERVAGGDRYDVARKEETKTPAPTSSASTQLPGLSGLQQSSEPSASDDRALSPVSTTSRVLQRGDRGADVTSLQSSLNAVNGAKPGDKGYVDPDGKFGATTEQQVRGYQKDHNQVVTGKVTPEAARAMKNVAELSRSAGFKALGSEQQRSLLEAQGRQPADSGLTSDLTQLANNPSFRALSPSTQSQTIDAVRNNAGDASARRALSDLTTSPGFGGLSQQEQSRTLDLVGGTNRTISAPARDAAANMVRSDAFKRTDAAAQTSMLRDFNARQPGLASTVTGPPITNRAPYTISAPNLNVPNGKEYMVNVGGRDIPVTMPANDDSSGRLPTIDQVAKGLAGLPQKNLEQVKRVVVDSSPNPADSYWQRTFGDPTHVSYMTAGANGTVDVYPSPQGRDQNGFDYALAHETGHIASERAFGRYDPGDPSRSPSWDAWRGAMSRDGYSPSRYAKNTPAEDFAESAALYRASKGDATSAAELRKIFPERFKMLDAMGFGN
jgi:peptidoglycan hydrolase-like protein with peptidoglycan-binding domain